MAKSIDQQVAMAFPGPGKDSLQQVHAEADGHLRVLFDALLRGCREAFRCVFSEPIAAWRRPSEQSLTAVAHFPQLPEAPMSGEDEPSEGEEAREARELLRVKVDFLRLTIHELRRPIGIATGYLSMVVDETFGEVPRALRGPLDQMLSAVRHMGSLVEGLAAVARIEDRADVLRLAPCRLAAVAAAASETVLAETPSTRIQIEQHFSDPELEVIADGQLLCIALVNLIGNAIKYSPPESVVCVRAYRRTGAVAIAVSDQGPGIEPGEADRIFEKYHRGMVGTEMPGLGLGLYIVHRIVELHGGLVCLDSTPGRGSTFTILLPVVPSLATGPAATPA